ncbi:hypothetical protein OHB12_00295 [Nocardia sp. NBC_01730]|nr:hypothetical protein OHB12_00295 [Nocardia sp. NBC_01730]
MSGPDARPEQLLRADQPSTRYPAAVIARVLGIDRTRAATLISARG